jgi:signal transduction histidine kinase
MNLTLPARLLISYAVLLTIMLAVITVALLLFLFARPAPPNRTYERLATIGRDFIIANQSANNGRPPNILSLLRDLPDFAQNNEVRALVINLVSQAVILDTSSSLPRGAPLPLRREVYTLPQYLLRPLRLGQTEPLIGSFADADGSQWLFVGIAAVRGGTERGALLLAAPHPTQTLESVLTNFGQDLALPVLGSYLAGLMVALILAAFLSRNISRPLWILQHGAGAVAEGHYDQRLPIMGPPEIRAVTEAFNRMAAQVSDTQQSQQDFLANVSHDLKTPLTSIQGYSQAIIDGAAKDPPHAARIIYDEAARLNRMVIQLTDLARLQAGRLSMQTSAIDLGDLAGAIGQRLAIVAKEKGVTLHMQTDAMPPIAGDGDRLAQVLTNLISNAIKYTSSGGSVGVKTRINNGGVEVIVKDTGIGIPPADLPRIFERFYQVDKARGPKRGTGLGLAITQEIIQAHGGRITVASPGEGQGSTFTIWIPSPQLSTIIRAR